MALSVETIGRIDLALSVLGLVLLLYLLAVYVKLYTQMRAKFTLGFILITVLLIFHNLSGTGFHAHRAARPPPRPGLDRFHGEEPNAFLFLRLIPNVLELAAIGVLIWLSRE